MRCDCWHAPASWGTCISVHALGFLWLRSERVAGWGAEGSATAGGSVWVSWSTGNYSFYPNQQAPSYPTSTIYAPQFADPASYNAVVRAAAGGIFIPLACWKRPWALHVRLHCTLCR